ncbi:MAG: hypothetical protein HOW97_14495 [Catenulispora sp.]|nr:hypothetical protein [Catenulispora sp.]
MQSADRMLVGEPPAGVRRTRAVGPPAAPGADESGYYDSVFVARFQRERDGKA